MQNDSPNIYQYENFRLFLKDYQFARYSANKVFTKGYFCKRMGIEQSRSYFNDVLQGKKVSDIFIDRFITVLEFDMHQAEYFRILVKYNQAQNDEDLKFWRMHMLKYREFRAKNIDKEFGSQWYHALVWLMLYCSQYKDEENDYRLLSERSIYPLSPHKIKKTIKLLFKMNIAYRDKNGYIKMDYDSIELSPEMKGYLKQYLPYKWITIMNDLFKVLPCDAHYFEPLTINISDEGYSKIIECISKYIKDIMSIVTTNTLEKNRNIMQIIIAMFPLTKDG